MPIHKPNLNKLKMLFALAFLILLIPSALAETNYIFKQDEPALLEIPIFENDISKCTTCSCTISISYPNGTNAVRDENTAIDSNYALYQFNETDALGVYVGDLYCTNTVDNGGVTFSLEVTPTGRAPPSGSVLTFFIALFLILLISLIYLFIYSFGHFMKKDFDLIDLAFDFGIYFALVAFYVLQNQYVGSPIMSSINLMLVITGAFTHILGSLIFFSMSIIWTNMDARRMEAERI